MSVISFKTQLYAIGVWTIAPLPQSVSKQLPSRGQVMVQGTINGAPVHTALEPDGNGGHWLHVDKNLQKAARVGAGDTAALAIEPTKVWPEPDIPADWQTVLDTDPHILSLWKRITPMARWEWLRWINSTAQPETRKRRIEVSCDKLKRGERRPCCFNRNMCCVPEVSKSGVLLGPPQAAR